VLPVEAVQTLNQ